MGAFKMWNNIVLFFFQFALSNLFYNKVDGFCNGGKIIAKNKSDILS